MKIEKNPQNPCEFGKFFLTLQQNSRIMEKNPSKAAYRVLQEVVMAGTDKASSKQVSELVKQGKLRKIAQKIYTSNMDDSPEVIIRRNLFQILGRLFPHAVLSHRSAFEYKPTSSGDIYLTYTYTRNISLPGLTVHLLEGPAGEEDDSPFIEGLYVSKQERAFLENLQPAYKTKSGSKCLDRSEIEERIEKIIRINGESAINQLRDRAKVVAERLHMESEYEALSAMISAMLNTKPSDILSSPIAMARAFGEPYDPQRVGLFQTLFTALAQDTFPHYPDLNSDSTAYRNFAFFESYFSNYIEGTEFTIEDAQQIIETGQPLPTRHEDSHDILGTFYICSNRAEMSRIPSSADELLDMLQARHRLMMAARTGIAPGEWKMRNNRAGDTHFVDYNLVKGTLRKGYEFYQALREPFARAMMMLFMVSEVHPFNDGNGRISRIMMNAELTHAGEAKIIIPTVFRDDYILTLRRLTRQGDPDAIIRAMQRVQLFSSKLDAGNIPSLIEYLQSCNAFKRSNEGILQF